MPRNISRRMFDALQPPGKLWAIGEDSHLDNLYDGMADNWEVARTLLAALANLRNPEKTTILSDMEKEYGLIEDTRLTEQERRDRLAGEIANNSNLGTADDLQSKLTLAGFNVQVHENVPRVDPDLFLQLIYGGIAGNTASVCGNETAFCGRLGSELLVNGAADEIFNYVIPNDSGYWPLIFFVGGDAERDIYGQLTTIERAQVPVARVAELKRLIIKYKPIFTWCGLMIQSV